MPDYRIAGVFLLLTALATAISVPARLMAGADLPTPEESLAAIGGAATAYGVGGAARLVGGLMLMAAGFYLWRAIGEHHPTAMAIVAVLLAASGIASAVSGASAIALAVMAPEPQATRIYTQGMGSGLGTEQTLFSVRWITGSLGFTLAGLALVALAPVQWRMGGILRVTAVVDAVLGVAMLFIWLDAATVVHRITGIAFLIWLIVVGLWLLAGQVRPVRRIAPRLPSE